MESASADMNSEKLRARLAAARLQASSGSGCSLANERTGSYELTARLGGAHCNWPEGAPDNQSDSESLLPEKGEGRAARTLKFLESSLEARTIIRKNEKTTNQNHRPPLTRTKPSLPAKILTLIVMQTIFSQLNDLAFLKNPNLFKLNSPPTADHPLIHDNHLEQAVSSGASGSNQLRASFVLLASALAIEECESIADCSNDKICHENRCICDRTKPVENQDRCLALSLIDEPCLINEQCMGNSQCVDGQCSCGNDAVSLYNPSTKIFYCHPKRRLNQECNYDSQCPANAFCSTKKYGCLCQNGFGPTNVKSSDNESLETAECLPKICTTSSSCESEYHQCEDNKCKCLAAHFDPTTAKCYKFGSTGGKGDEDELLDSSNSNNGTNNVPNDNNIYSILTDLTHNSDRMWLVLIILIVLSLLLLALILMAVRKYYLGYCCWTANKKEYEPNNKNGNQQHNFNKNSINNKSFRKKSADLEDGEEDEDNNNTTGSADSSNLMTTAGKAKNQAYMNRAPFMTSSKATTAADNQRHKDHSYVEVDMNTDNKRETSFNGHYQRSHQQVVSPLASSTSTPV